MAMITDVWQNNLNQEFHRFNSILHTHQIIAFDTEFPGFIQNTPRDGSDLQRYDDLKYNVDRLKLIQLGVTLFDAKGNIGGTWQFNFGDFNAETDLHVTASIDLLRRNGVNFEKMKTEGIPEAAFACQFSQILLSHHQRLSWVTFHGLYDLGYLMKLLKRTYLPISIEGFVEVAGNVFGNVYDTKFICRFCNGCLDGKLGLERLAKILKVDRFGEAHQAGSDSLLTASIFLKMMQTYRIPESSCRGCLSEVEARINVVPVPQQFYQPIIMPYSVYYV